MCETKKKKKKKENGDQNGQPVAKGDPSRYRLRRVDRFIWRLNPRWPLMWSSWMNIFVSAFSAVLAGEGESPHFNTINQLKKKKKGPGTFVQ